MLPNVNENSSQSLGLVSSASWSILESIASALKKTLGWDVAKFIEKLAEAAARAKAGAAVESNVLSKAIEKIARRSAQHERDMERIKGDMQRGARTGKGRFRI